MAIRVKVKGLKSLERRLKKNASLNDVKSVVSKHGSQMQQKMVQNADFHGHYEWKKGKGKKFVKPTGATRRSIHGEKIQGGFGYEAGPTTHYSPYLEFGTRFMEAQPFVKPSFDEQKGKFKKDLKKLTK